MKYILGKKKHEPIVETILVSDYGYNEVWSCDKCNILFERDDYIVVKTFPTEKLTYCPRCDHRIWGGTADWYNKEYEISEHDTRGERLISAYKNKKKWRIFP